MGVLPAINHPLKSIATRRKETRFSRADESRPLRRHRASDMHADAVSPCPSLSRTHDTYTYSYTGSV